MLVQYWAGLYPDEMQEVVMEGVWTMLNTATQLLVPMPTSGTTSPPENQIHEGSSAWEGSKRSWNLEVDKAEELATREPAKWEFMSNCRKKTWSFGCFGSQIVLW